MRRAAAAIRKGIPGARVYETAPKGQTRVTRLDIDTEGAKIKIEVTPVLGGCIHEPQSRSVSARVEQEFGFGEMEIVSFADLYAGKIVAALDRQHPRVLFDVRDLLKNEGISDELRRAFVFYVVSSDRPFVELLEPARLDISQEFERGFNGMTDTPVTIDELVEARERLIADVVGKMPTDHKKFLLSLEKSDPEWTLLGLPVAETLPAVRWRLENLSKMDSTKRAALLERLRGALQI